MNIKRLIKTWRAATNIIEWMGGAIFNGTVSATGALTATGGVIAGARYTGILTALTYGAAIALNAALGNEFVFTITDANAFVLSNPTNAPTSGDQVILVTYKNASGGAHGAGTFGTLYKVSNANFAAVANGFNRTIAFRWDGTNWVEIWRTAADVAN